MGRAPALIALLATGCSAGHPAADATTADAPLQLDADLIDFAFSGAYVDWDSTSATPCPIIGATWTAHYDGSRVATTDANGAFTISLTSSYVQLDVLPPAATSTCTTPHSSYEMPATAIVPPAVYYAGGHFIARAFTAARGAAFYSGLGAAFDPTRGNLLVHVDGPLRAISISSAHEAAQAFDGTIWAAGATGSDVYFPNVDVTATPMTTVTVAGGAIGTGAVALSAGQILYMTVITK